MGDHWDTGGDEPNPFNMWDYRSPKPFGFSTDEEGDEGRNIWRQLERERRKNLELERRLTNNRSENQSLVEATIKALMDNLPTSMMASTSTPTSTSKSSTPTSATVIPAGRYMRMPIVGTPGAPLMFTGTNGRALLSFFATLEKCFRAAGIQTGAEKVVLVPDYVQDRLREWVEGLGGYKKGDYEQLKTEIYSRFGNPQNQPRYRREDLFAVIEEQQAKPLKTVEELYLRAVHFEAIANPLLEAGKVTDVEVNRAYFRTLPLDFGVTVHSKLKILHPAYDTKNEPFPREWVKEAAEREIGRDWYEVQESGDPRSLTQRMAEVEKQAAAVEGVKADPSLDDLVQSLSRMNIHDAAYAQSHAVLARVSPAVSRLFPAPAPKVVAVMPSAPPVRSRSPAPNQNPPFESTITRAAQPVPQNPIDPCFYCWETGHRMGTCPDLWSDESKGFIKRENNRLVFKDGTSLRKFGRGMREDVLGRIDAERGDNQQRRSSVWTTPDLVGSFLFQVEDVWRDEVQRREAAEPAKGVPCSYADLEEDVWARVDKEEHEEVGQLTEKMETEGSDDKSALHVAVVAINNHSDKQARAIKELWTHIGEEHYEEVMRLAALMEMKGLDDKTATHAALVVVKDSLRRQNMAPRENGGVYQNEHLYQRSEPLSRVHWQPTTTMGPDTGEEEVPSQEKIPPPPYQCQPMPQPTMQTQESWVTIPRVTSEGKEVEAPIEDKETYSPAVPKLVSPMARTTTDIEEMAGLSVSLTDMSVEAPQAKRDRYLYKEAPAESILAQSWIHGHVVVAIDDVDPYKKPIQDFVDPSIQVPSMVCGDALFEGSPATAATCMVAPMTVYQGVPNIITSGGCEKSNADIEGHTGNGDVGGEIAVLEKMNEFAWTTGGGKTEFAVFGKVPMIEAAELLRRIDEARAKLVADRAMSAAYKKVDKKVWSVPEVTLEEGRTRKIFLSNSLDILPAVPYTPPPSKDGKNSTRKWLNNTNINLTGFLKAEEMSIFERTLLQIKQVSALDLSEFGRFKNTNLLDYKTATLPHTFLAKRNVLVPPAMLETVNVLIREMLGNGTYETAEQLFYGGWWLALATKDGGVRVTHNRRTPKLLCVLVKQCPESMPYPAVVFKSSSAVFYLKPLLATTVDKFLHAPVYVPKTLVKICDRSASQVKSIIEERQAAIEVRPLTSGDPEEYDRHRCILFKGSSKQITFRLGSIAMSTTSWHNLGVGMHTGYLACWQIYEVRRK